MASSRKSRTRNQKADPRQQQPAAERLRDVCRYVFAGGAGLPPPDRIARLREFIDGFDAEDFGLVRTLPFFEHRSSYWPPPVTYLRLYKADDFEISVFCLPESAVIPLHNHPGMTVFSKILFGSMHIKSYDWVDDDQDPDTEYGMRLAKVHTDAIFTAPCETKILYPRTGGNMHRFTALTACAVLDVLGPPYAPPERNDTYYDELPYAGGGDHQYTWLRARSRPDEFILTAPSNYRLLVPKYGGEMTVNRL